MEHINQVIRNAEHEIDHSSKTSPTAAGRPEKNAHNEEIIGAINQLFSLFRVNYHNQFYAAYSDSTTLNQAKRMWLNSLQHFSSETILQVAKQIIEGSEYVPTLHKFISQCDKLAYALPSVREAYIEACMASEPKENVSWSHPIVYHAGKTTGWFFLRSQTEQKTLPVFEKNFYRLSENLRNGQMLETPEIKKIEEKKIKPLNNNEQKKRVAQLLEQLDQDE